MGRRALVVGASGIVGSALTTHLLQSGWAVHGMSRGGNALVPGAIGVAADLTDPAGVKAALAPIDVDSVFITAWSRQVSEKENIRVNGAIVQHVLDALGERLRGGHVGLVTGLKHYLGPFEAYASGAVPITPFRESQGRQPVDNFYYEQEDRVFAGAKRDGFTWSVHRPHTIIGTAMGNAMNMGQTLAVYASLCKFQNQPFVFPGSEAQWQGLTDMTDARILARQLTWAATAPAAQNQDFNIVNGDIFRWKWMWSFIADYFGVEAVGFEREARPLEARMGDAAAQWRVLAEKHHLAQPDIDKLVSWWHTDADLGRPMEVVTDMSKSRQAGFLDYQSTPDAFVSLFDTLKASRLIPG